MIVITLVVLFGLYWARTLVLPPSDFPKTIPTIPFYVTMLPLFIKLDQTQIYNQYIRDKIEKYGAVNIYFASRWNVLVSKPELLLQVFKDEDTFAKSGNQIKIPYSVLAAYTGDNVISAHGENWRKYRKVVTASIQHPDLSTVENNTASFVKRIGSEPLVDLLQKLTLANVCDAVLGIDADIEEMHPKIKFIKQQIFKPIFMTFAWLDQFVPSRLRALREVSKFKAEFCQQLSSNKDGFAASQLLQSYDAGELSEKQVQDNAIILMVAGHENPLLLMLSLLFVIAKYELEEKIMSDEWFLDAVVCETLRMYPPLGQIINRCTTRKVTLGEQIIIPKGAYVGYNNFATGHDPAVWSQPEQFMPERWGTSIVEIATNFQRAKRLAWLPAFHGRRRACLGEKLALYECKMMVRSLLKVYSIQLDPEWPEKFTPAGPICPVNLRLKFNKK
ncbi:cytochrome P450-Dit2p [Diutina catenulata]